MGRAKGNKNIDKGYKRYCIPKKNLYLNTALSKYS